MTPLVLLPGMMCDARLFGPQIAALRQARRVIVGAMNDHDTIAGMAAALLTTLPDRFALAGLSMGGVVAMEIIAQAPARVERLALMDTNPCAELPAAQARREPQIAAVQAGNLRRVMRNEMKPYYLTDGPHRAEILELCMQMALDLGPEVFVRQSRGLQTRLDRQDVLTRVGVPTLVLCGAKDALCPVERHRLMHRLIARSVLEIIQGAGHLPVLERPIDTIAAMQRWLKQS